MESFSVNELLPDNITKIDGNFFAHGNRNDVLRGRAIQDSLAKLIDKLGEQSAEAQGLKKNITTFDKLRQSTWVLYLLKDPHANNGNGQIIGMLKMGRKQLFLFDDNQVCRESNPLCVLDFYVRTDVQRQGHGRRLFDHMLQDLNTRVHLLAIDGPSSNMQQFLKKNYGLGQLMRQSNNFAITTRFFSNELEDNKEPDPTPALSSRVGRYAAMKPNSEIKMVIHGEQNVATGGSASPVEQHPVQSPEPEPPVVVVGTSRSSAPSPVPDPPAEPRGLERPRTLRVDTIGPGLHQPSPATGGPTGITCNDSQLTDKGFFDVKFYHNKLW